MKVLCTLVFCCAFACVSFGQTNYCYDDFLKDGDDLFGQFDYQKAIDNWQYALNNCGRTIKLTENQKTALNLRIEKATTAMNRQTEPTPVVTPAILSYEPETVAVQGGTFSMGSTDSEASSDEKPVHSVTLSSFRMGKYEITVTQFKAFVDDSGYKTDAENGDGSYIWTGTEWKKTAGINWRHDEEGKLRSNGDYPVVHVSWNDADAYCKWLSRKTSKKYRLPTEAEWEYAAGNGSRHTKYSWGNSLPSGTKVGNVADETAKKRFSWTIFDGYTDGYVFAAPVGSFSANDFGLHDMTGNVWEWCNDWYDNYSSSAVTNPTGAVTGSHRVHRGGGWDYGPQNCRVAHRNNNTPTYRLLNLGFRVAYSFQ